jgi:hypothetical protein
MGNKLNGDIPSVITPYKIFGASAASHLSGLPMMPTTSVSSLPAFTCQFERLILEDSSQIFL